MIQKIDKDHPLVPLINKWKKESRIKSETYEDAIASTDDKPIVVSWKIDGELCGALYDGEKVQLVSREGRIREDLPVTQEISSRLKSHAETILIGELYVVDEEGKPLPYPKAMSILRKPKSKEDEQRIRFAVIDIKEVNGAPVEGDYWQRALLIQELFKDGDKVHPVAATLGDASTIKQMWEEGVKTGIYEGLVLYTDKGIKKIKPVFPQDLAVIGVERSRKHPEVMGALLVAYLDDNENFRSAGKVGTGFTQEERREWMSYAQKNKIRDNGRVVWVKPDRVIQVASKEFNIRYTPTYNIDLEKVEDELSAVGREPSYEGRRLEKSINTDDLRMDQIPGWDKYSFKLHYWARSGGYPEHPDTVIIPANDFYKEEITEAVVFSYYDRIKTNLVSGLGGSITLVVTAIDDGLVRRKDPQTGEPIRIKSVEDFDKLNNGRSVEFHKVVGRRTKYLWVDLDPQEKYPWEDVKRASSAVSKMMSAIAGVQSVSMRFSGGRGFHVVGELNAEMDVDDARKMLIDDLNEQVIPNFKNTTTSIAKDPSSMRLDTSTLHDAGSLRSEWSLNIRTGLVCLEISKVGKTIENVEKSDFTIDKVMNLVRESVMAEKEKIPGGLSSGMTVEDVAKKHDVPVAQIEKQLAMGINVELEHVIGGGMSDEEQIAIAREIALDHLCESPSYYTELSKMEKGAGFDKVSTIVKRKDGYHVMSESGKNMGGPYKTREQAVKRLKQVEFFKHHKGGNHLKLFLSSAIPLASPVTTMDELPSDVRNIVDKDIVRMEPSKYSVVLYYTEDLHSMTEAQSFNTMDEAEDYAAEKSGDAYAILIVTPEDVSRAREAKESMPLSLFNSWIESAEFKFDPNSTENEGRWRLRDPQEFDQKSFKRWKEWSGVRAPDGVSFIVGDDKKGHKRIQTIRFDKSTFDEKDASKYWESIKDKPGFEKKWKESDWHEVEAAKKKKKLKDTTIDSPKTGPSSPVTGPGNAYRDKYVTRDYVEDTSYAFSPDPWAKSQNVYNFPFMPAIPYQ